MLHSGVVEPQREQIWTALQQRYTEGIPPAPQHLPPQHLQLNHVHMPQTPAGGVHKQPGTQQQTCTPQSYHLVVPISYRLCLACCCCLVASLLGLLPPFTPHQQQAASVWSGDMTILCHRPAVPLGCLAPCVAAATRFYHNLEHIMSVFDFISFTVKAGVVLQDPAAVDWAVWFHDAVYDPKRCG